MTKPYTRLDKDKAAVLLIDHQAGLSRWCEISTRTSSRARCRRPRQILQVAHHPDDELRERPNGPLVPELKQAFPDAPFIPRPGQINAWDNEDFVKAVKGTK